MLMPCSMTFLFDNSMEVIMQSGINLSILIGFRIVCLLLSDLYIVKKSSYGFLMFHKKIQIEFL